MRKYIIGILIGAALSISATSYADEIKSLIGKKIQGEFPISINENTLDKKAIVIDGSSYLPVRAMGDALGLDVSFNAELGIELKKKEVEPVSTEIPTSTSEPSVTEEVYDLNTIDFNIRRLNNFIGIDDINIENLPNDPKINEWKAEKKKFQDELTIWEARKAALNP